MTRKPRPMASESAIRIFLGYSKAYPGQHVDVFACIHVDVFACIHVDVFACIHVDVFACIEHTCGA